MTNKERQNMIIDILSREGKVKIDDLAERFNVSIVTIRRDLCKLEAENIVKRIYGGAILSDESSPMPYQLRTTRNRAKKACIGHAAASLVAPGNNVFLDIGTTVLEVAKNLKSSDKLTVITNSLTALSELESSDGIQTISIGGRLMAANHGFYGYISEQAINSFCVDIAFVSAAGLSMEYGITSFSQEVAHLTATVINRSNKVVLLIDSSKFGKNTFAVIGALSSIDTIITDDGITEEYRNYIQNAGIELIIADTDV